MQSSPEKKPGRELTTLALKAEGTKAQCHLPNAPGLMTGAGLEIELEAQLQLPGAVGLAVHLSKARVGGRVGAKKARLHCTVQAPKLGMVESVKGFQAEF